ncbi:hypothetical protein AURDEDRAFT_186548, partial [Auricularia subglabra TFB-10046 SS5]
GRLEQRRAARRDRHGPPHLRAVRRRSLARRAPAAAARATDRAPVHRGRGRRCAHARNAAAAAAGAQAVVHQHHARHGRAHRGGVARRRVVIPDARAPASAAPPWLALLGCVGLDPQQPVLGRPRRGGVDVGRVDARAARRLAPGLARRAPAIAGEHRALRTARAGRAPVLGGRRARAAARQPRRAARAHVHAAAAVHALERGRHAHAARAGLRRDAAAQGERRARARGARRHGPAAVVHAALGAVRVRALAFRARAQRVCVDVGQPRRHLRLILIYLCYFPVLRGDAGRLFCCRATY